MNPIRKIFTAQIFAKMRKGENKIVVMCLEEKGSNARFLYFATGNASTDSALALISLIACVASV